MDANDCVSNFSAIIDAVASGSSGDIYEGNFFNCFTQRQFHFHLFCVEVSTWVSFSSDLHRSHNVRFIVFISGLRCSNCTAAVPTGSNLCKECSSRKLCDTCHKPLLPHSFDQDMQTCKSCVRRLTRPITRSALRRTVVEVEIPTYDYDLDLGVFLNNNAARITEILQQALDEHSWVSFLISIV